MPEVVSGLEDALFHSTSKSLAEASIHASVLSKREKASEGTFSIFCQSIARVHAMDLFDVQNQI